MWRSTIMIAAWRSWESCGRFRGPRLVPDTVLEQGKRPWPALALGRRVRSRAAATLWITKSREIMAGIRTFSAVPVPIGARPTFVLKEISAARPASSRFCRWYLRV